jgi:hypothetical protein
MSRIMSRALTEMNNHKHYGEILEFSDPGCRVSERRHL